MSGDMFGCHNQSGGCHWNGMSWDVARHPPVHGTAPTTHYPAQDVNSVEVEKS